MRYFLLFLFLLISISFADPDIYPFEPSSHPEIQHLTQKLLPGRVVIAQYDEYGDNIFRVYLIENIGNYRATGTSLSISDDGTLYLPVKRKLLFTGISNTLPLNSSHVESSDSLHFSFGTQFSANFNDSSFEYIDAGYSYISNASIYEIDSLKSKHFTIAGIGSEYTSPLSIEQDFLDQILTRAREVMSASELEQIITQTRAVQDSIVQNLFHISDDDIEAILGHIQESLSHEIKEKPYHPPMTTRMFDTVSTTLNLHELNKLWIYDTPAVAVPYFDSSGFHFSPIFLRSLLQLKGNAEFESMVISIDTLNLFDERRFNWSSSQYLETYESRTIFQLETRISSLLDSYNTLEQYPQITALLKDNLEERWKTEEEFHDDEQFSEEKYYLQQFNYNGNDIDFFYNNYDVASYVGDAIYNLSFWSEHKRDGTAALMAELFEMVYETRTGSPYVFVHTEKSSNSILYPVYFSPNAFSDPDNLTRSMLKRDARSKLLLHYMIDADSVLHTYNSTKTYEENQFSLLEELGSHFFNSELNYYGLSYRDSSYQWNRVSPEVNLTIYQSEDIEGPMLGINIEVSSSDSSTLFAGFPDNRYPNGFEPAEMISTESKVIDTAYNYIERTEQFSIPDTEQRILSLTRKQTYQQNSYGEVIIHTTLLAEISSGEIDTLFDQEQFGYASYNPPLVENIVFTDINGDGLWDIIFDSSHNDKILLLQLPYGGFEKRMLIPSDGTGMSGC